MQNYAELKHYLVLIALQQTKKFRASLIREKAESNYYYFLLFIKLHFQ